MTHAAESTHFYTRDGKPAYTVKAKAGHDRPTTLADARKLALVPSVTTIIKCADRPGLNRWMLQQMMLSALTATRREDETEVAFLQRIEQDSREQARKAAERGTAIHAAIQGMYEGQHPGPGELWHYCMGADAVVSDWLKSMGQEVPEVQAERSFAHVLGFGGKCDLSGTPNFVLDFKTKEFGPEDDLKVWEEHGMQLAAYRMGLGMEKARCAIVYVSVTNPGLAKLIEIPEADLVKGWKCFHSLLQFWRAKTGYDSSFSPEAIAA